MVECSMCSIIGCAFKAVGYMLNTIGEYPFIFIIIFTIVLFMFNTFNIFTQNCLHGCKSVSSASNNSKKNNAPNDGRPFFDYSATNGPHTWTFNNNNQSPINIVEENIRKTPIREMLLWSHFEDLPEGILIENTGNTVVLRAAFSGNIPTISGGDLLESYTFVELCFRWSATDFDGSEHMFNYRKFPLEMQTMFRTGPKGEETSSYDILFVAYFFEIAAHNHYLDPFIQNLQRIRRPQTRVEIPPFPLSYLCFPFRSCFYSYAGSLTEPPCYQGAEWFVFPEPFSISPQQLNEFRELLSHDGMTRIVRNYRPVQCTTEHRIVNFNYFCPINISNTGINNQSIENTEEAEEDD